MSDVAKAAGVSTMTVSRALRKDGPISDETRERILEVVRKLHYVPDLTAGSLSSKKSGFVTALLPSLDNLHFAQTVQAMTETLEKVGLQILLGHTNYCSDKEEELIELMLRRRPEAIILSYDGHTERSLELLKKASIPVVQLWETPEEPIQHTVGFSNFDAARQMTEALIAKGYKKLAFLGEAQDAGTRGAARRAGFVAAMEAAGLSPHRLVRHKSPPVTISIGAEAGKILLKPVPRYGLCVLRLGPGRLRRDERLSRKRHQGSRRYWCCRLRQFRNLALFDTADIDGCGRSLSAG